MTTAQSYPPTPYINAALLPKSVGKTVRIVAANKVQLETTDGRNVTVVRPRDAAQFGPDVVCVTGVVQPDCTISEGTAEVFPGNFDMANFNKVTELAARMPQLFHHV